MTLMHNRQWSGRATFEALLVDLFDAASFRRWICLGPEGDLLISLIPPAECPLVELVHQAVSVLLRRGIVDVGLFERLGTEFPQRKDEVALHLQTWIRARPPSTSWSVPGNDPRLLRLAEQLDKAYDERELRLSQGRSIEYLDAEIIAMRRSLREGPHLNPGDCLLKGRYRLLEKIGAGAFSFVWRGIDREQQDMVAIKVLHAQFSLESGPKERFARGARAMSRFAHENIAKVFRGAVDDGGYVFYVMELAYGDLERAILENTPGIQTAPAKLELALRICKGLACAHQYGVVHRDVKPANVLLDKMLVPKLADFDLVRVPDTTGGTAAGQGMGTYIFGAPEALTDANQADFRSDVYSLGITMISLFRGAKLDIETPHRRLELIDELICHPELKGFLRRAVAFFPDERHASAIEMAQDLEVLVGKYGSKTLMEDDAKSNCLSHGVGRSDEGGVTGKDAGRIWASVRAFDRHWVIALLIIPAALMLIMRVLGYTRMDLNSIALPFLGAGAIGLIVGVVVWLCSDNIIFVAEFFNRCLRGLLAGVLHLFLSEILQYLPSISGN